MSATEDLVGWDIFLPRPPKIQMLLDPVCEREYAWSAGRTDCCVVVSDRSSRLHRRRQIGHDGSLGVLQAVEDNRVMELQTVPCRRAELVVRQTWEPGAGRSHHPPVQLESRFQDGSSAIDSEESHPMFPSCRQHPACLSSSRFPSKTYGCVLSTA